MGNRLYVEMEKSVKRGTKEGEPLQGEKSAEPPVLTLGTPCEISSEKMNNDS